MIPESDPEREAEAESEDQSDSKPAAKAEADSESEGQSEGQSEDQAESEDQDGSRSESETRSYSGVPPLDRQFRPVEGRFYLHQYTEGDDDVPKWCPVKVYANGTKGKVNQAYVEYWSFAYSMAADGTLKSHQADLGISDKQWEQVEPMDMIQFNDWNLAWVDTDTLQDPDEDMSKYNPRLMWTQFPPGPGTSKRKRDLNPPGLVEFPHALRWKYPANYKT